MIKKLALYLIAILVVFAAVHILRGPIRLILDLVYYVLIIGLMWYAVQKLVQFAKKRM